MEAVVATLRCQSTHHPRRVGTHREVFFLWEE